MDFRTPVTVCGRFLWNSVSRLVARNYDCLGRSRRRDVRWGVTAVVVTWLSALVLAAPTMIRMWTQPDEPEENCAVGE